jgi:hypothetical protein
MTVPCVRSVRVWEEGTVVQTIYLPAISCCNNLMTVPCVRSVRVWEEGTVVQTIYLPASHQLL